MNVKKMNFSFEYCALRFLLIWQRREIVLHDSFKVDPSIDDIRKALRHFKVARNFKGLKDDVTATKIRHILLRVRSRKNISEQKRVLLLADAFEKEDFLHNISAASKLLWLSYQAPVIIYDSRAYSALKFEYEYKGGVKNYEQYCDAWRTAYKESEEEINRAVKRLSKVRMFTPGERFSRETLLLLVNQRWFKERVFDIYLWERGEPV